MAGLRLCARRILGLIAVFIVVAAAQPAAGQTLLDPTTAEFSPSPDHDTTLPDGTSMVDHYELYFYQAGATQPLQTVWLGKPAPDSDGLIRANFSTALVPTPPAGVTYDATVGAVGPTGTGVSSASNTFEFSGGCTFTASPTLQSVPADATTGSVSVATTSGCAWTAVSNTTSWLTITAGASSTGPGTATYAATANTQSIARSGSLTVAGQTITVTQAGACTFSVSPLAQSAPASGGTASATVTTGGGCSWTGVSNAPWLTVSSGSTGTATGTVGYNIAANTTGSSRTGTLTIAGQTLTVNQAAACSYAVSPLSQSIASAGGSATISVTTATGCAWTAASQVAWITVTAGASGTTGGSVSYSVAPNTSSTSRSGTILVAGQSVTVTQAGAAASCSFSVSPTSAKFGAAGGVGSATVTTASGCAWTAVSNAAWITVTGGATGAGSGPVYYSVASNPVSSSRSGTLTVAGVTVTITQSRKRR